MKLHQKIMRLLAPLCERQREEFRIELARASACAEDLHRTVTLKREEIEKALREYRGA